MAGYLDEYGVADERRTRTIKNVVVAVVIAAILGTSAFYFFRNRAEERVINNFIAALKNKDYQQAYALWGCTQQTPCRYYSPDRFAEDWGPSGLYKNPEKMHIEHIDTCGANPQGFGETGVVFNIRYGDADDLGLWVERKTKILSYAPWPRCPGPHLQIFEFLKSRFGVGSK